MKTIILLIFYCLPAALFAQDRANGETPPSEPATPGQTIETDTATNCLTLRNGRVILMQHGKATRLMQDTLLPNGTRITTNGTIIRKNGSKMIMKTGECFSLEGIRMSQAGNSPQLKKEDVLKPDASRE